jgi:uncharacterized glyoxalase superfamily protein PhnB
VNVFEAAIPVLHVSDSTGAEAFYCDALGFEIQFAYRPNHAERDPCYMGLKRDSATIHVSSFAGDAVAGGVVYLVVQDVDAVYRSLHLRGVAIDLAPTDQSWSNREMYVKDRDGNSIRFVTHRSGQPSHRNGPAVEQSL